MLDRRSWSSLERIKISVRAFFSGEWVGKYGAPVCDMDAAGLSFNAVEALRGTKLSSIVRHYGQLGAH